MKTFVKAQNLKKIYNTGKVTVNALGGINFEICEGEFAVILGQSGAGKTTLLNIIGGMDSITSGDLFVDGTNLNGMSNKNLTTYRRHDVGFVFQFYNLMPNLTALENIELATELCKDALDPKEVLAKVGLSERMNNFPAQLSGGEQQRVSIARAIAKNPKILLCDEPTGALDYETGKNILRILHKMCKEENKTVIVVTHNASLKEMADRVIHIKNGLIFKTVINQNPKDIEEIEW